MAKSKVRKKVKSPKKQQDRHYYTRDELYEEAFKISNNLLETLGSQVRQCFKDAMRENRISEARADRIADRANELMKIKAGI